MSATDRSSPRSPLALAGLIVFGSLLFAAFVGLGSWQLYRLDWKIGLIARVHARVHADALAPPGPARWAAVSARRTEYLHVRVTGHYLPDTQTLVQATTRLGRGFWVMTPLQTERGFIVLINRGFVTSHGSGAPSAPVPPPAHEVTVTGLVRMGEPGGGFLRPNTPAQGRWYSRDVAAITKSAALPQDKVAPYFIDADAGTSQNKWPVGGLTTIHFRNAHLVYAITWYALAGLVLIAAVLVTRFELHNRRHHAAHKGV
ncbi:MAG: SURF1 family protein [Salinisphaera sp.]|nr:SURF1 family protein [Salinisphaera sp.]